MDATGEVVAVQTYQYWYSERIPGFGSLDYDSAKRYCENLTYVDPLNDMVYPSYLAHAWSKGELDHIAGLETAYPLAMQRWIGAVNTQRGEKSGEAVPTVREFRYEPPGAFATYPDGDSAFNRQTFLQLEVSQGVTYEPCDANTAPSMCPNPSFANRCLNQRNGDCSMREAADSAQGLWWWSGNNKEKREPNNIGGKNKTFGDEITEGCVCLGAGKRKMKSDPSYKPYSVAKPNARLGNLRDFDCSEPLAFVCKRAMPPECVATTTTPSPTERPTEDGTTPKPTSAPTTPQPTNEPTMYVPPAPSSSPSVAPTDVPTTAPSEHNFCAQTCVVGDEYYTTSTTTRTTTLETEAPTSQPTATPSTNPTQVPTAAPTTPAPTGNPTIKPTRGPTEFSLCDTWSSYVFKKDDIEIPTLSGRPPIIIPGSSYQYHFSPEGAKGTVYEAKDYCENVGGDLVQPESAREMLHLAFLIRTQEKLLVGELSQAPATSEPTQTDTFIGSGGKKQPATWVAYIKDGFDPDPPITDLIQQWDPKLDNFIGTSYVTFSYPSEVINELVADSMSVDSLNDEQKAANRFRAFTYLSEGYGEQCVVVRGDGLLQNVACSKSYNFVCRRPVPAACYDDEIIVNDGQQDHPQLAEEVCSELTETSELSCSEQSSCCATGIDGACVAAEGLQGTICLDRQGPGPTDAPVVTIPRAIPGPCRYEIKYRQEPIKGYLNVATEPLCGTCLKQTRNATLDECYAMCDAQSFCTQFSYSSDVTKRGSMKDALEEEFSKPLEELGAISECNLYTNTKIRRTQTVVADKFVDHGFSLFIKPTTTGTTAQRNNVNVAGLCPATFLRGVLQIDDADNSQNGDCVVFDGVTQTEDMNGQQFVYTVCDEAT